ncbi:hypothetical protein P9B97_02280 [Bacillus paralicheniformis]|uniref:hypothetical protein n=1 Tax=Bacillus paralicheniformis TaxID=1648923 RepID=UPI002DBD16C5|nr:hypothetical protein [Bacillus paralicheniformis]MEC1050909.1 hypothetical protein [Bacillus paralicheniformis]MEC1085059.1 hypothetical protein [Bacillus paralicheniformis]MEC1108859.1 hypothetical protein [Bacillus paralicheniformis]MEC1137163.1 hypothetical protein [Bacillus paralicheniformis]MEC1148082.1 hypothetical protein [Bacillus paralicheniformis]
MPIKEKDLLNLLKRKGFDLKTYENTGSDFYTLVITERSTLEKIMRKHLDEDDYFSFMESNSLGGLEIVLEIQTNFETPQCVFTWSETTHHFENLKEFHDYVEELPDKLSC